MPGGTANLRRKQNMKLKNKKAQGAHNRIASLEHLCGVWSESPHNANDLNLNDDNRQ